MTWLPDINAVVGQRDGPADSIARRARRSLRWLPRRVQLGARKAGALVSASRSYPQYPKHVFKRRFLDDGSELLDSCGHRDETTGGTACGLPERRHSTLCQAATILGTIPQVCIRMADHDGPHSWAPDTHHKGKQG